MKAATHWCPRCHLRDQHGRLCEFIVLDVTHACDAIVTLALERFDGPVIAAIGTTGGLSRRLNAVPSWAAESDAGDGRPWISG
jgi:hypothetical protein